jgi:hypothetical protein
VAVTPPYAGAFAIAAGDVSGGTVGGTVAGWSVSPPIDGVRTVVVGGAVFAGADVAATTEKMPTLAMPPAAIQPVSRTSRSRPASRWWAVGCVRGVVREATSRSLRATRKQVIGFR